MNLKTVAERVGLAPCSVSAVLNDTTASRTIPQTTKDRIFRAAAELNYRPNFWARSLRMKRTRMVAAVTPDLGRPAVAAAVAAAQDKLSRAGYLLVLTNPESAEVSQNPAYFHQRGIEGVIAIAATLPHEMDLPLASVDLDYLTSSELFGDGVRSWISESGAAAAENLIRQIEAKHSNTYPDAGSNLPATPLNPAIATSNMYQEERGRA